MKWTVAILGACALLLLSVGPAGSQSQQIRDLKKQVDQLQKKVEDLEEQQAEQAETVDELQEQPSAYQVIAEEMSKQTTVGAHFKFYLADQSRGKVDDVDEHNSFSAGISNLWLLFSKGLNDWISVTLAPEIAVLAEATPALGSPIERSTSASVELNLDWAYMHVRLPWEMELKAGAFYPLFSEEYGSRSWWHEQYNANTGLITLEGWRTTGLELYRNFDFAAFSLPVYFYCINGEDRGIIQDSRYVDNNSAKNLLLHLSPEFYVFGSRLRLLGSIGGGRWDDAGEKDSLQWAAGAEFAWRGLMFMGEYMDRTRNEVPLLGGGTEDGTDKGWYVKGLFTITPQWKLLIKYSDVDLWAPGNTALLTDNYKVISGGVDWWVTDGSTIIFEASYNDANQTVSEDTLEYFRYTVGWRTTF